MYIYSVLVIMPKCKKECYFNPTWLDKTKFPAFADWLQKVDNSHAGCKICDKDNKKPISVRAMGISALYSHVNGKKHSALIKNEKISFFSPKKCNIHNTSSLQENFVPTLTEKSISTNNSSNSSIKDNVNNDVI